MKKILPFLLIALFLLPLGSPKAQIAEQPCDTQIWRQMHAKAWLESEREIMMNQNLIFKPDSVIEYTCFDQFVRINAWDGGNIFTHTNYFGSQIIPRGTPQSLEEIYQASITDAVIEYQTNNFNHNFLGGRAPLIPVSPPDNANTPATDSLTGSGYLCEHMANLWRATKCMNFIHNSNFESTDGFYPFDVIVGLNGPDVDGYAGGIQDVRNWPTACGSESEITSWADQIELATNQGDALYAFHTPLGQIYQNVYERTLPGTCTEAVLTGVTVVTQEGAAGYADGVCTNAGCGFTSGGSCQ
ncbi:MAG: hypothetical protein AAF549_06035 [Pseudomonadota bacterium]